ELYKKDFYETRSLLLEQHKDFWLSLNPFYEGLIPLLHPLGENVFIISTKKKSFLLEILKHSKINFKEENVFCSEEKYDLMHSLLNNQEVGQVYFIDDQSSHFKQDALIKGYLALWGYIKPEETYTNAIDFLAFIIN
ncbi:MAG: hypothetical protein RLZZ83_1129, partial [Pseudomonadota bacterium]